MSEVLYSMLIGALVALFFSIIFGIPKFIGFIAKKLTKNKDREERADSKENEEKPNVPTEETNKEYKASTEESDKVTTKKTKNEKGNKMKHSSKRIIIIAICSILAIAVIALTTSLILTIKNYQETIEDLEDDLEEKEDNDSKDDADNDNADNVKVPFSFDTVNDLITAVKSNPSTYANKKITVKGTILKKNDHTAVCDLSDVSGLSSSLEFDVSEYAIYRKYKENNFCIDIVFYDDLSYSVATTGDYVELGGTVKVSNGKIILDNCECEIIKFASERK